MKLLRVTINDSDNCVCGIDYIKELLGNECEIGDKLEIEIIEMKKELFEKLSEFQGF